MLPDDRQNWPAEKTILEAEERLLEAALQKAQAGLASELRAAGGFGITVAAGLILDEIRRLRARLTEVVMRLTGLQKDA